MEREGIEYVVAAYAVTAATLALWFGMIGVRMRKLRRQARARSGQ